MTTAGGDNQARDGRGRYRRELAKVERDASAAELACKGWSYDQIAGHLGYSDKAAAWRAVQRALGEAANTPGLAEARAKQLAEMALLKQAMWSVVDEPGPAVDRLGRVIRDDNGDVVPDQGARANAAAVLLRVAEREARLHGMDAPKRSVTITHDMITARIAELKAELGLDDRALEALLAGRDGTPRVVPGAVEDN